MDVHMMFVTQKPIISTPFIKKREALRGTRTKKIISKTLPDSGCRLQSEINGNDPGVPVAFAGPREIRNIVRETLSEIRQCHR
jgi:hypothetical protein